MNYSSNGNAPYICNGVVTKCRITKRRMHKMSNHKMSNHKMSKNKMSNSQNVECTKCRIHKMSNIEIDFCRKKIHLHREIRKTFFQKFRKIRRKTLHFTEIWARQDHESFLVLPFISTSHKGGPILVEDTLARTKFKVPANRNSSRTDKRSARQGRLRYATLYFEVKA